MISLWDYYKTKRPRTYVDNWHLRWQCYALERAVRERRNLIIEAPPRHSKSELSNVYMPAWRLEENFEESFMMCTNADQLARKFSIACQNLVNAPLEAKRDTEWRLKGVDSLNYSYRSSGRSGQMTGHGCSVLLLDDLVKNGQEAKSDTVRESIWDSVVSAALNRLTPDGICIALQARLHEDDPLGRLLALDHMDWMHLHLPAVNPTGQEAWFRDREDETLFPAYEALWPSRYSAEKLADIKSTVTSYYWNAQFICRPSMGDMAYFQMDKCPRHKHPNADIVWMSLDAANTATKAGSYSALVGMGFDAQTGHIKILDARRGRWRQDQLHVEVVNFYLALQRLTGKTPESVIVERAAAGYGVIDGLSHKLPIEPLIPKGSKEERAAAICYLVNRGSVSLPESAPWLEAYIEELSNFPLCSNNDWTDATVHGLSYPVRPSEFKPKDAIIHGNAPLPFWERPRMELDEIDSELDGMGYGVIL
jgi:predicted phage terminase large subunit-like protein